MARNDHSGYPMKWFKDENAARRAYECVICLEVVKDAVQVRDCGHQFCALCIDDILKADPRCPSCRIEISATMVFADHAARRLIKQLEVNCCNEGCSWTGCLGLLLQSHQNNCNFLIQRDDNNAQKLKVEELEQKHDNLLLKVLLFEQKHEQDITVLKIKHEQDIKELNLKHEEDIKELKLKHQKDIGDLQMKHEQEKQEIRDLQLKHQQEKQDIRELQLRHEKEKQSMRDLQLKHEQDIKEIKLMLQQTEGRWQQQKNEDNELCEEQSPQKSSRVVVEKPVEIIPVQSDKPLGKDSNWEGKGKDIGDEIKVEKENDADTEAPVAEQIRRKYERDFLLQFQYMPVCTEKPAGLPEIEVVLDAPVPPSKGGSQRGSDFLPSFARQKSQGGGGGRRDSRGKPPPRKMMNAASASPVVLKKSENPWQRPKENEKELTEEEKKSAKFYRNVVAILNKLTPQTFKSLMEQIMALNIDTPERLEGVIDRIFERAVGEPVFSAVYADMCRCLFAIKVSDAKGKDVSFRKLLLSRCQKEFEKEQEDAQAMLERLNQLEGLSEEEKKVKKEEMDKVLSRNKRRMLGNIKFIGELFKLKLLTENIMHDCIFKLLRAGDEESLECACKLFFTIGKDLDSDKVKPRIEQYFDQIKKIITTKKVSSRVVFMLRDVVELRDNKWIPRREENYNPKTFDQIHKEAELEKKVKKRLAAKLSAKKLESEVKRAHNEEISLGPTSRFGQWGRGSSAGNNNSSQEQDQPQGNRYSALSSGGDMLSNRPFDLRRPASGVSRSSSGNSQKSDENRIKSDENVQEALQSLTELQDEKPQATIQPPPTNQEKLEAKESEEPKGPTEDAAKEAVKEPAKEPLSEEESAKKTTALINQYPNIPGFETARNPLQYQRFGHIPNGLLPRNQQGFPIQNVMMQGPHQVPFIPGHPMAMAQRPVRGRVYSSSPLGSSPMQGYMQYQVAGQDGQPVIRPSYIPNVQQPYQGANSTFSKNNTNQLRFWKGGRY